MEFDAAYLVAKLLELLDGLAMHASGVRDPYALVTAVERRA